METKRCSRCKEFKTLGEFCKHKGQKDGLNSWCRKCYSESSKAKRALNPKKPKQTKEEKKAYKANWYKANRARIRAKAREEYWDDPEAARKRGRETYLRYREHVLEYQFQYHQENIEKVAEYHRKYLRENRDKINQYTMNRYYNDVNFRIAMNLRSRINAALKGKSKLLHSVELIGCSIEQLEKYIESMFAVEMSWDNYGSYWEVDHIIPCAAFDLSQLEEQKRCFHWTNLQPLEAVENNRKNDFLPDGTRARKHRVKKPKEISAIYNVI